MNKVSLFFIVILMSCGQSHSSKNSPSANLNKSHLSTATLEAQQTENKFPVISIRSGTDEIIDIMVTADDGSQRPLSEVLTRDKNYIVSLMASWCGPCRTELNAFQKVSKRWSTDLNTDIVAISIEKPTDTHKLFALVKKQGWTMDVFHDKMAYTSRALNVFDIPHTFLINQSGEIVFSTEGFRSNIVNTYETEIKKIL